MKNSIFFTPPPKKSHFNVFQHIMHNKIKKIMCISSVVLCFSLTACAQASTGESTEASSEKTLPQISSFGDYEWGTSYEKIKSTEISDDMKEIIDYREDAGENEMISLTINNQETAGFSTSVSYVFSDNKLTAGGYDIGGVNEESYSDLSQKLSSKYGDPYISKESTGWGRLSVWIDNSHNAICLSEILDVLYIENDSPYLDFINEQFIEFHETDLIKEIEKFNNTNGL